MRTYSSTKNTGSNVEEYPDGTKAPMFVFYENGDTFWIACPCEHEDPEIYYIGQDGMERLVKNKGQG